MAWLSFKRIFYFHLYFKLILESTAPNNTWEMREYKWLLFFNYPFSWTERTFEDNILK